MITLENITNGAIIVSVNSGTVSFETTNDRAELQNLDPVSFSTVGFAKTEIIVHQHEGNNITNRMLTRADTGTVVVIDNGEIMEEYLTEDTYLWTYAINDKQTNSNGCLTFTLDDDISLSGVSHYLVAYRKKDTNDNFVFQRFRVFYNLKTMGLKLFDTEGEAFDVNSAIKSSNIEMKVYGIETDEIIEGHWKLERLLA